ncbi:MAG: WD40 repeat domain-containing protein, partial [Actinobacteria bacterium]
MGVALVCAVLAGAVAVDQRRNADDAATEARQQAAIAQDQTQVARARRLLSEAQVIAPENLSVALLLASEAVDLDPTIDTTGLIGLIPPRLERIQTFGGQAISTGVVGPDGRTVPVAADGGDVYLWDAETGTIEQTLKTADQQNSASIASDGRHLVTAGTHSGEVAVWDLTSGEKVGRMRSNEPVLIADPVSADASLLLVSDVLVSASLVQLNGDSSRVLWTLPMPMSTAALASRDGKLVAAGRFLSSGAFEIVLYDANTQPAPRELAVLRSSADAVWSGWTFGPDSQVLAESNGSDARLYDLRDPTSPTLLCSYGSLGGKAEEGGLATFSSDGQLVAVGRRGAVAVIAVPSCEEIAVSSTKQGGTFPLGFVGDGADRRVVVGSDTEIRVLRVAPAHLMARVLASSKWPFAPVTAPFTVQYDANDLPLGTAWQFRLRGSELGAQEPVSSIASSSDGLEAASFGDPNVAGSAHVVLSRGGRELARIDTGRRFGPYVWFTPDGRR